MISVPVGSIESEQHADLRRCYCGGSTSRCFGLSCVRNAPWWTAASSVAAAGEARNDGDAISAFGAADRVDQMEPLFRVEAAYCQLADAAVVRVVNFDYVFLSQADGVCDGSVIGDAHLHDGQRCLNARGERIAEKTSFAGGATTYHEGPLPNYCVVGAASKRAAEHNCLWIAGMPFLNHFCREVPNYRVKDSNTS
jgi:hypothetical protein